MDKKITNEEIKKALREQFDEDVLDEMVLFESPSYASAVIGVSEDNRLIYDFDLMVECLMDEDGMDAVDAIEFIEYNTIRALPYIPNHPIIKHNLFEL
jgi:hypothetical protein